MAEKLAAEVISSSLREVAEIVLKEEVVSVVSHMRSVKRERKTAL